MIEQDVVAMTNEEFNLQTHHTMRVTASDTNPLTILDSGTY